MSWLWGSSTPEQEQPVTDIPTSSDYNAEAESSIYENRPIFALDQIKNAGMPIQATMSPYLQMDPSIFRQSAPQLVGSCCFKLI